MCATRSTAGRAPARRPTSKSSSNSFMSNPYILGGAMLPHAPQFFTQPETEDKATIAEVQQGAAKIGDGLKALKPEEWIVIGNDHAQQFFANVAPPFTLHVGGVGRGQFAGRDFKFNI